MSRGIGGGLALALAALALAHPTFSAPSAADAIGPQAPTWLTIHTVLLLAFPALAWHLGRSASPRAAAIRATPDPSQKPNATPSDSARSQAQPTRSPSTPQPSTASHAAPSEPQPTRSAPTALALFALANTAYVAIDGLLVGILATRDPGAADALWTAPWLGMLANLVGAMWAAALLLVARTRLPRTQTNTLTQVALALTWLCFVASAVPGGLAPIVSRAVAALVAALAVYSGGMAALSAALLVLAGVFRIHAGPEAALGLLLLAGAEIAHSRVRER